MGLTCEGATLFNRTTLPAALDATAANGLAGPVATFEDEAAIGRRTFLIASVAITLAGLGLRVWNLGAAGLWTDEAMTAMRAQAPFQESLDSIVAAGNQTPLYFWLLRLFPNSSDLLLRLPSVLVGVLGIALMIFAVLRLYHSREMALWAGTLLAVNPFHVWLSRTARPYALVFTLALFTSYLFLMILRGHRSRAMWIAFTISSMVTYFAHFTSLALFAAEYITFALIVRREYRLFRRWIVAQIIAAIPTLTWVYYSLSQPHGIKSEWIPHPVLRDLPLTLWNLTLGYDGVFHWAVVPALVIVTFGIGAGLIVGLRSYRSDLTTYYWVWLVLAPWLPVFVASRLVVSIYVDRYFTTFEPALLVLLILGLRMGTRRMWRAALIVVMLTSLCTVAWAFHDGSYQRADWRGAAHYVAGHLQPGDVILLERDNTRVVFDRYFTPAPNTDAPAIVLLSDAPDPAQIGQDAARVWVLYRNPNEDVHRMGAMPAFDPWDPALSDMGAWLSARHGDLIEQRTYKGVTLLLLNPHAAAPDRN